MTRPRPGLTGRNFKTLLDHHPTRRNYSNIQSPLMRYLLRANLARVRGRPDLEEAAEADLQAALAKAGKASIPFDYKFHADREW
jgi:hypothetical protein